LFIRQNKGLQRVDALALGGTAPFAKPKLPPRPLIGGVTKHVSADQTTPFPTAFGGYDSPFEIGFEIEWDSEKLPHIKSALQSGKELASESESGNWLFSAKSRFWQNGD